MSSSSRLPLLLCAALLSACSPTTPLFIAQITTNEVVEYKTLKNNRMLAAIEDEGDLLTYSAQAIRDEKLSDEVRAISLYQIGLLYMNRFNDQRDDNKALNYFYQVLNQFPASRAAERAEARIVIIRKRADEPVQKTSRELLVHWKPNQQLDLYKPSLDPDMTLLSRRAVLKNRVSDAEELYLLALSDPGIPSDIKEKALSQLGLMYLAPDNQQASRDKAITYLRRLLVQYPSSELNNKAARHLDQALNR